MPVLYWIENFRTIVNIDSSILAPLAALFFLYELSFFTQVFIFWLLHISSLMPIKNLLILAYLFPQCQSDKIMWKVTWIYLMHPIILWKLLIEFHFDWQDYLDEKNDNLWLPMSFWTQNKQQRHRVQNANSSINLYRYSIDC